MSSQLITYTILLVYIFLSSCAVNKTTTAENEPKSNLLSDYKIDEDLLIPYQKDEKWGFMNIHKQIIIPANYDHIKVPFDHGVAVLKKYNEEDDNYYYGLIDREGNEIHPFKYFDIEKFNKNGFAKIMAFEEKYTLSGLTDRKGNLVFPTKYVNIVYDETHDLYITSIFKNKTGIYTIAGLMNIDQEWILEPKYRDIKPIKNTDLFIAYNNGKYGIIDIKGNVLLDIIHEKIKLCKNENYLFAVKEGKKAFFDLQLNQITPFKYKDKNDLNSFHGQYAIVETLDDDRTIIINTKGEFVYDLTKYNYIGLSIQDGDYLVISTKELPKEYEHYYIRDSKGLLKISTKELIIDPFDYKYEYLTIHNQTPLLYSAAPLFNEKKSKLFDRELIDESGNILVSGNYKKFRKIYGLPDYIEMTLIENDIEKVELFNFRTKKILMEFEQKELGRFLNNGYNNLEFLTLINLIENGTKWKDRLYGIVSSDGQIIIEPKYKSMDTNFFPLYNFWEKGLFGARYDNEYFMVDLNGNEYKLDEN
ncbi:WG repeat-containing protein [Flammeovirga yaeyamensis]|uniref:WG repeat-containing protein n=1 Tax=Flammeovirga yaeyamensis TaxID=367791 RepID=A0AAX1N9F2_9BACT|nr:WG repeat-containing protein [Flammeovirga yaeyamensis]MBB3699432.1 hypothetical protein [Flammeovirga yaeyamensis]NMF35310.1 hypothetical protein [Flammeovirga yaeyamensis]QWG04170.1 WG repeat-containing protein [Flammeovirga yaeyamensis]